MMKRRAIAELRITDHAVLRYLERQHGIDVEALRRHLAGPARNAAELGAVAVQIEAVRLVLVEHADARIAVVTCTPRSARQRRRGRR